MTRYSKQIEATRAAHMASRALSDSALLKLDSLWDTFDQGNVTIDEYSERAKEIVTEAYVKSADVARYLTQHQAELEDWTPLGTLEESDYLQSLLSDVDRNVAEYKNSDKGDKDARKLKLRVGLSAITAAERGFTDSQLLHYGELEDMGYRVTKLWLANFTNNEPCVDCVRLNGTVVPFDQEFPVPTLRKTAVYRDLQGPPLHVRCKCVMVVLITRADNLFDKIPTNRVRVPTTMSTDTVKSLPRRIFDSIVSVLRTIIRGASR